jgi:hypothetical protein
MNKSLKAFAVSIVTTGLLISCGSKAEKNENASATISVKEEVVTLDIDTVALTTKEAVLDATKKVKEAGLKFEEMKKSNTDSQGDYYRYLKIKGIVSRKTSELIAKLPGNERADFLEKVKAIRD